MPSGRMRDTAVPVLPGHVGVAALWEGLVDGETGLGTQPSPPDRLPPNPGPGAAAPLPCPGDAVFLRGDVRRVPPPQPVPSRLVPSFIECKELLSVRGEGEGDAEAGGDGRTDGLWGEERGFPGRHRSPSSSS